MAKYYDELITSHLGCNRILKLLSGNYYLSNVRKYIETYIVIYNIYARVKALYYKPFSLL